MTKDISYNANLDLAKVARYIRNLESLGSDISITLQNNIALINDPKIKSVFTELAIRASGVMGNAEDLQLDLDELVSLYDILRKYSQELEEKSLELERALFKVKNLKDAQDRDYFLIYNLLSEFKNKKIENENIHIEFLIKQHKEFSFKNKTRQIGGDLIIHSPILLQNNKYDLLVTSDAMGKSLQGATGSVVFAALLNCMIVKTGFMLSEKTKSPEKWLKTAFLELQHVFQGFNCSMMISAIMLLINDETGTVYYLNAEYPEPILYENGSSRYLTTKGLLKKLGDPFQTSTIQVNYFQMNKGQSLFIGSDGKDEIYLDPKEFREKAPNYDSEMILNCINEAKAKLDKVRDQILERGSFRDDFSMVKVSLTENLYKTAFVKPESAEVSQKDIVEFIKQNNYKEALTKLRNNFSKRELELSSLMYLLAYCCKKTKNIDEAACLTERLFIRHPDKTLYLYDLVGLCITQKEYEAATDLLQKVPEQYRDESRYIKLENTLIRHKNMAPDQN